MYTTGVPLCTCPILLYFVKKIKAFGYKKSACLHADSCISHIGQVLSMGAFVIVRFMGLLDAVDDALFVALGQELQVHGQDG